MYINPHLQWIHTVSVCFSAMTDMKTIAHSGYIEILLPPHQSTRTIEAQVG